MTTITRRVTTVAAGGATKRVAIHGHNASYDAWAGSWGPYWGLSWRVQLGASELSSVTRRVKFHHRLVLEGDESGKLLLEGDVSGDLGLEGDEAKEISSSHTRRVTLQ